MINTTPPTDLPQHLLNEYSIVKKNFIEAIRTINPASLEKSFDEWMVLLDKITNEQTSGMRYHKGGEVHNMGACKLYTHQAVDALHYYIMGYIEDLLSLPLENANKSPGALTLTDVFKLSEEELGLIQNSVQKAIETKGIVQNPLNVLENIMKLRSYDELENKAKKVSLFIQQGKYPSISKLPGDFDKRVFIGGDYESIYLLDGIIGPVSEYGYVPIVAAEFNTEPENIHHHALLLLHNSKYAIFDVSSKGGHMMEAERTLEYGTETLFVCNKTEQTRVSGMLRSLGKDIKWFEDREKI